MAFYKISSFKKSTKKMNISDQQLLSAAQEVQNGKFEANLGGGVIKKRIAIHRKGKSGGIRVIIFFKVNNHLFFADGWTKSTISSKGTKEIEDDELEAYKQLSKLFLSYTDQKINELITHGILEEIIYE
ncbi:type II toxin-antitoxin system RelE/ParE family toxin [Xenorhabdus anantnagensis]|uniref:Type II toxin-antitoxin system RelE/ParE family toxin n=1 Tax=Xenorhabdus anantnagensis TaxID=3025875 RepID=A0ABT5LW67_9GAMM|nr:type II toxin-antitoxin system RelE/ParE family toxin [Xenorhabdus anantnagensis]